ncbi:hypothetical protein DFQ28_008893 [Apophysomyces sp. BC1034]|nr:hypothetical protein DFQ28_008893 [Apophysomyces sp. BC1034]
MTNAGVCMTACSKDQQDAFGKEFSAACQWYDQHKNDKCDGSGSSGSGGASGNGGSSGSSGTNGGSNGNSGSSGSSGTSGGNGGASGSSGNSGGSTGNGGSSGSSGSTGGSGCQSSYSVPSAGDCIKSCNQKAGTGLYSEWTNDPSSPNFLKSLSYQCAKGTDDYMTFMTNAGVCMTACSKDQQDAFGKEFSAACQWYDQHKNGKCDSSGSSGSGGASGNGGSSGSSGTNGGSNGNSGSSGSSGTSGGNGNTNGTSSITSASKCNPSYSVPSAGDCIKSCNQKAGTGLYKDWTNDPAAPNFVKSLSYQCAKGTVDYMTFMTDAGICMTACSKDQQDAFGKEFSAACTWYDQHKNDKCDISINAGHGNGTVNGNPGNRGNGTTNANPGTGSNNGQAETQPENASSRVQLTAWSTLIIAAAVGYIVLN